MTEHTSDEGIITVLLERLTTQRLPRILDLQARVEHGERLSDYDIGFLSQVMEDAERAKPLCDRNPQLAEICTKMVSLYGAITSRALANEGGDAHR